MKLLGTIALPGEARSAGRARVFVRDVASHVHDDTMADIALCVDELVANACEHTASGRGGQVVITVSASDDLLRITVLDDGGTDGEPRVQTDLCAEDGRGLLLVDALSTAWNSHAALSGTAVWAEFAL